MCLLKLFSHQTNTISAVNVKLYLNGITLKRVENTKYLGIFIDEKLTWQVQIQYIINKLLKFCCIFSKLREIILSQILKTLYFSLVHPHLIYCIEIYANTYAKYLDPLVKLNNKLLRILQNRKLNFSVKQLYTSYNTLPVPQLHNFTIITLLHKYKFSNKLLPLPFQNYFTENYQIHKHNTRQVNLFHFCQTNTSLGQRSIKFKGCKLWNDTPEAIRLNRGMHTFKRKLKLYLINDFII